MRNWKDRLQVLEKQGRVKRSKRIGRPNLDIEYFKITLYGLEHDWNKVISLASSSAFKYGSHKKKQLDLIFNQLSQTPKISYPAKYIYNWYEPNKKKDPGNIAGGEKLVADALQEAGIIPNDGWAQIKSIEHRFYIDKENPRLELEIVGI